MPFPGIRRVLAPLLAAAMVWPGRNVALTAPGPVKLATPATRAAATTGADRNAPDSDFFIDRNGTRRPFHATTAHWFPERPKDPAYLRAFGEMGILLTLGSIYYWARPSINRYDWDLPSVSDRLSFHAVRFDNNLAITNFISHPFAGSTYYGISRLNGLTVPESALYTIFTSVFWEYVLEFREQVSINDMIFTPFAGIPIGAFLAQASDYFDSAPGGGSTGNQAAAYTLGLPRKAHPRHEDLDEGPWRMPPDSLGFSSAYHHEFRLGYEEATVDVAQAAHHRHGVLTAEGQLVGLPGFLRPGRFRKVFAADTFSDLRGRVGITPGVSYVHVRANGTLVGAYQQDFRAARGGTAGHAEMIGLASGLRYVETAYGSTRDMYASTPMLGIGGAEWLAWGPLRVRLVGEIRYDFAAARSLALPLYVERHGDTSLKSVLTVQGYQFEMGIGGRQGAAVQVHGVTLGVQMDRARYKAMNALDRTQEQARDVNAHDTIGETSVRAGFEPEFAPLYVGTFLEWTKRESVLGDTRASRLDTRWGAAAGLRF